MSGYCKDYSMSVNAKIAYSNGEKPMSKWTKDAMLTALKAQEVDSKLVERAKTCTTNELRNLLLVSQGWHHTSKCYRETYFYSVEADCLTEDALTEIEYARGRKAMEKKLDVPKSEVRYVSYLIWSGTRNHPKAERYTERCEVKNGWAYTSRGRKSILSRGFRFVNDNDVI